MVSFALQNPMPLQLAEIVMELVPATLTTSPPKEYRWRCCSCSSTNVSVVH